MSRSGLELVHKWIDVNINLGMSEEQMDGLTFVYGSDMYRIHKKKQIKKALISLLIKEKWLYFGNLNCH